MIIVWTPEYREWTGGIIVLHLLANYLKELGEDVAFAPRHYDKFWSPYSIPVKQIADANDIVVYPESAKDNFCKATRIVTYYLGNSKKKEGYSLLYSEKWAKLCNIKPDDILYLSDSKHNFFYNMNLKRSGECFTVRKNRNPRFIHKKGALEIKRGVSNEELRQIFNTHERFICYDTTSFLNTQAAMCGCDSIIAEHPGMSAQLIGDGYPDGRALGISYGLNNIDKARSEHSLLKDYFIAIESEQKNNVKRVFEKIKRAI